MKSVVVMSGECGGGDNGGGGGGGDKGGSGGGDKGGSGGGECGGGNNVFSCSDCYNAWWLLIVRWLWWSV